MERLTRKVTQTRGGRYHNAGDVTVNTAANIKTVLKRLAAYEDIGTVEEFAKLKQAESEVCDRCIHKLQSDAWKYCTYPCSECKRRTKDYFEAAEAALAAKQEIKP